MKLGFVIIAAGTVAIVAASPGRSDPLGRSAGIHRPFNQVNKAVTEYFASDSMHDFQIVSQNQTRSEAEIVARRTVEDQLKWSAWAYCRMPAMQMVYTLQQGNVTVRVKVEREGAGRTYVTVTPAFEGIYQFAGNQSTQQCMSNGVLEKDILRAAGANDAELN